MISPVIPSFFTASLISVRENVVKNILFRASTLLLQYFIFRIFTFMAARQNAYTSYLMFAEDIVQKIFYAVSRKFNRQAVLVLGFAALISLAGLYDTLLWALDLPGYVIKSKTTSAGSLAGDLLTNPSYITLVSNPTRNVHDIDIDAAIAANLFTAGLNFSLSGVIEPGVRETVPLRALLQPINSTGPRIWLDEDGFSVSVDQYSMATTHHQYCPMYTLSESMKSWECWFNNTDALYFLQQTAGNPAVYWDGQYDEYLSPYREDNPWFSLGNGGDTTLMKQVFTVTKNQRRHTFIETVFKTGLATVYPTPLNDSEITDILQRTWPLDPTQPMTSDTQPLANNIIYAQRNQITASFGIFTQQPYASLSSTAEFLNVLNPSTNQQQSTVLRITSTNITLIRSETLFEPPPAPPCHVFSTNLATGGQVRAYTCSDYSDSYPKAFFVTQMDSSAVIILNDLLGDGSVSTSAVAFNQTGWNWYLKESNRMDNMLISRALILGGNRSAVQVEVQHNEAALSYLQLLLMLLPILLVSGGAVIILRAESMSYYNSSLLAAVCATTHITTEECEQVGYLHKPPEITLRRRGRHIFLGTPDEGTLANVGAGQAIAYGMVHEPWVEKEGSNAVEPSAPDSTIQ